MMSPANTIAAAGLPELVGSDLEPSAWMRITQERVDRFADATEDHQFIHVDPARAASTPFGGTVAHGFLTLSLLPHLTAGGGPEVDSLLMVINYGSDRVRFLEPVRVGDRVRVRQTILEAAMRRPGQWLVKTRATVDIEGREKPALIADLLTLYVVG